MFLFWLVSCFCVLFAAIRQLDGLCKGPHSLSFAAFSATAWHASHNSFSASTNLWNDLAKAMKASDGKKKARRDHFRSQEGPLVGPF